jgi:hypothetical protein
MGAFSGGSVLGARHPPPGVKQVARGEWQWELGMGARYQVPGTW